MRIKLTHNLRQQVRLVQSVKLTVEKQRPEILQAIGIQVTSLVQRDFEEKSRGRAGRLDGVKWLDLTDDYAKRKAAKGDNTPAPQRKKRKKSRPNNTKGTTFVSARSQQSRSSRNLGRSLVASGTITIGIDNGKLSDAINAGYEKIGSVNGRTVTLEVNKVNMEVRREYAPYFDAERPIFPKVLPIDEVRKLERIAGKAYEAIIKRLER
ncbi:hypothetical protein Pan216_16100 [Planctomycetes bacterium Pan216]|uniref:Phage virion morphogenesis family protein n=1 Tax=Kolteria novifilia TaxID=2527975 RepID=A0A518B1A1_9BACT|nr:hypothetical protein Pan216_16100 [Planctomycetes bacterium Pan216]